MKRLFPLFLVFLIAGALFLCGCFPTDEGTPGDGIVTPSDKEDVGENGPAPGDNDENQNNTNEDQNTDEKDPSQGDENNNEKEPITSSDPYVNVTKEEFYANYTPDIKPCWVR